MARLSCLILLAIVLESIQISDAFVPSLGSRSVVNVESNRPISWALEAKKKRRRRRKQPPGADTPVSEEKAVPVEQPAPMASVGAGKVVSDESPVVEAAAVAAKVEEIPSEAESDSAEEADTGNILDVAKFKFDGEITAENQAAPAPSQQEESGAIPLPDIREALKKKRMEEELSRAQEEEEEKRVRIKRSDKEAFAKLLEQQPYADADDSYFEKEEYNTVSALLAEGAKPFLGIPSGPLQVGHFIGSLVIVLMAFVEYPGFPLTNLPTPLRGALQGGLLAVYAINVVLAVLAVFKAGERGQPAFLWAAKTFSVGGLAFDQLTQLPTLEEIETAKARKGKRALKNRK